MTRPSRVAVLAGVLSAALLAGCSVETATTAATAASLKAKEAEQGQRTIENVRGELERVQQQR